MGQGFVDSGRSPSSTAVRNKEEGGANQSCGSRSVWRQESRGVGNILPNELTPDAPLDVIDSGGGIEYGVSGGHVQSASEQSRGGRWANLPPELRAIKDRWLGASSETITTSEPRDNIDAPVGLVAVPLAHGYRQDEQQLVRNSDSGQTAWDGSAGHAHENALVQVPQCQVSDGGAESSRGETPIETLGKGAQRQYHGDGNRANRGYSSSSKQEARGRADVPRTISGMSDGDILLTNLQAEVKAPSSRRRYSPVFNQQQHQQQQQQQQAWRQHQQQRHQLACSQGDSRVGEPGSNAMTPRSGDDGSVKASEITEVKANGSLEDAVAPRKHEVPGDTLAPAFGDALTRPSDTCRQVKDRKHAKDLKSRPHPEAAGDTPPDVCASSLFGTPTRPPSRSQAHSEAVARGDAGKRQGGENFSRTVDGNRPGRRQATLGSTKAPSVQCAEADDVTADRSQPLGRRVLLDERKATRVGLNGLSDAAATVFFHPAPLSGVVEGRPGNGENGSDTTSTTSRPSELIDSLDLSVSAPPYSDTRARDRGRSGSTVVAAIPASVQSAFTAGTVSCPTPQGLGEKEGRNVRSLNITIDNPTVVVAVASTTRINSRTLAGVASLSPPREETPDKTVPAETTAVPDVGGRTLHALTGTAAKISGPERHVGGSPKTLPKTTPSKTSGASKTAKKQAPGVSRLRAPGWGREASISSIPPATNVVGVAKLGTVPAKPARDVGATPSATAPLPWDLLTPVTEAPTADERSVASHGTRGTTRITPASSVASGCRKDEGGASGALRERVSHRSPHCLQPGVLHRATPAPGICKKKAHSRGKEFADGRSRICRENRAMLGTSPIDSGARSAQCQRSVPWTGPTSPRGGPLSSVSAYRASPSCGTSEGVRTRCSTFSSASEERTPGRQAGGGYIAAMGRRARSVARREAARRSAVAAMVAHKTRPSTPISERARWGKGKESQVEIERKKLLRRRAEYAEELQRKAKEDAKAVAERRAVATTTETTMLPADPRHVRAGAGSGACFTPQHGAVTPTSTEAGTIREAACFGSFPYRGNKAPHLLLDSLVESPAFCRQDHSGRQSSAGRTKGDDSIAFVGQELGTRAEPRGGSPDGEEERLMASIARLDTLLREDNGKPHAPTAAVNSVSRKDSGGMECKAARMQAGGVAKARVRRGGRETKAYGSAGSVPVVAPKTPLTQSVPVPTATSLATNAVVPAQISPGMFPPLFGRTPAGPGVQPPRARCLRPGEHEKNQTGPPHKMLHETPASHVPVEMAASPLSNRMRVGEERRRVERSDGGFTDAPYDNFQQRQAGQLAWETNRSIGYTNDRNDYDYRASVQPRYFVRREGEMFPPGTRTSARYWDPAHGDDRPEGHYVYGRGSGASGRFRRDDASIIPPQRY
ncbi:unnamed protein product [Scytosiphon promiscuus]